jgi:predicted MFS family arabinose efflux permease
MMLAACRLHPGWLVLIASFAGVFATTPGQTVGVSSFIDPIAADLGLERERVLVLYSIGTFLGILTAPSIGRLVDRFGPRRLIVPVVVALAGACAFMSLARGALTLGVGFVLLRASAIAGLSLVSSQMVNLWFDRLRGRVTAFALMGLAMGGLIVPPFAEAVMQAQDWRSAYLALGGGVLAIMLPVGLALYRDAPENSADRDFGRSGRSVSVDVGKGLTLNQAARTTVFWYLVALTFLVNAVNTALLLDHARALMSAGLSRSDAITLLGAVTTTQVAATLLAGMLVDRHGSVILVMSAPGLGGGLVYAAALGAMIGILQVAHSAGLAEQFGLSHLGSIRGTTFVIGVSGAAVGPLPLLISPMAAYSIFLGLTACGAILGLVSLRDRAARLAA